MCTKSCLWSLPNSIVSKEARAFIVYKCTAWDLMQEKCNASARAEFRSITQTSQLNFFFIRFNRTGPQGERRPPTSSNQGREQEHGPHRVTLTGWALTQMLQLFSHTTLIVKYNKPRPWVLLARGTFSGSVCFGELCPRAGLEPGLFTCQATGRVKEARKNRNTRESQDDQFHFPRKTLKPHMH